MNTLVQYSRMLLEYYAHYIANDEMYSSFVTNYASWNINIFFTFSYQENYQFLSAGVIILFNISLKYPYI